MAYEDLKGLPKRIASDRVICDKAFSVDKNAKYDGYQRGIAPMNYKYFDKSLLVLILHAVLLCMQINLVLKMKLFQTKN